MSAEYSVVYNPVPGYAGYLVGSDGSVWSAWRATGRPLYTNVISEKWRRIKPQPRKEDGRTRHTLRINNRSQRMQTSHIVLLAFVGPCPPGMEACHNNGDCTDDRLENLRWDTPIANKADMLKHGTRQMGENHPKTKLSDADIQQIISIKERGATLTSVAGMFGVTLARISQICKKGGR